MLALEFHDLEYSFYLKNIKHCDKFHFLINSYFPRGEIDDVRDPL